MPEAGTPARRSLSTQLALAFVVVGLGSASFVVAVVALTSRSATSAVARDARQGTTERVGAELASAYSEAGGRWEVANLTAAAAIANGARAALIVRNQRGTPVGVVRPSGKVSSGTSAAGQLPLPDAAAERVDVVVGAERVGSGELRFAGTVLTRGEQRLRDALVRNAILAALVTALLGLAVAGLITRRLRPPLVRLAGAARRLEAGDPTARVAMAGAPGELGEVAAAFDHMADTLEQQREARAAMVSDLAHEVRTPLAILRGNLEELIDGHVAPNSGLFVSLQDEVLRLERLTDDLRALSESDPSFVVLELASVDLTAVVARAAAGLQPGAAASEIDLVVTGDPLELTADAGRLDQVVANLLTNAVKFTPPGGVVEAIVSRDGDSARLVVTDTGPGIPAAELPRVFDRFWRGDGAEHVGGTGVGLAVVQRLVEAHGGTVAVDNAPRGGARFTVRLPLR